ncbi:MAG: Stp1/IreP family PP2C-type Ser/Thr phosphatase [Nitrospinae bacterium]|nr:Stp1/IreP family PP2C-type Ser/Thr phosphatase [Nitrospinota bacterium]
MKTSHCSLTDVGLRRQNNEDFLLVDERLGLFLLADGMGGHNAGETASRLALASVQKFFEEYENAPEEVVDQLQPFPKELPLPGKKLIYAIIRANTIVTESAELAPEYHGMGTTIVALHVTADSVLAAHVGDSRIYLRRKGEFNQITEDHSVFFEELKKGFLTREQLEQLPFKNRLTRALGHMEKTKVDMKVVPPHKGDIFLLCSDGLTDMVDDAAIGEIIGQHHEDLEECAHILVESAKAHGGVDNISVVLLRVDEP